MLDTNVLISIIVLKSKMMNKMLESIIDEHKLVLASYVIDGSQGDVLFDLLPGEIPALAPGKLPESPSQDPVPHNFLKKEKR